MKQFLFFFALFLTIYIQRNGSIDVEFEIKAIITISIIIAIRILAIKFKIGLPKIIRNE